MVSSLALLKTTLRSQVQKKKELFPNDMEKYNWHCAARQTPKILLIGEEIQEFKR